MSNKQITTQQSSRALLYGIWQHLSKRRRIQLGLLLLVMLASGLAEVFSLAAVLPFLAVLSDPQRIWQQPVLQGLAKAMGITAAGGWFLPPRRYWQQVFCCL